jgi:hypothetical protein
MKMLRSLTWISPSKKLRTLLGLFPMTNLLGQMVSLLNTMNYKENIEWIGIELFELYNAAFHNNSLWVNINKGIN